MSWKAARDLGRAWVEQHLPLDMKGRLMQFSSFETDEECRFFYPSWTSEFQKMVVNGSARLVRKRGAKTTYRVVTIQDYLSWLQSRTDSPQTRREFLDTIETLIG